MKFIDQTAIYVKAGDGGRGMVSFRHVKGRAKAGADGGNGGNGGSVILQGNDQLNTLAHLRYKSRFTAEPGVPGGSNNMTGRCGKDKIIPVPLGTVIFDEDSGLPLSEITDHNQKVVVAKGGKRGYGNLHFLSSIHQAPSEYLAGTEGEEKNIKFELKLMADVGLAGFPNAGKSTMLSSISAARPKIADYPFTTLAPQLGVVALADDEVDSYGDSFVMADIPGLIEGAADGRGLGHDFLKHIERTAVIAYVLDAGAMASEEPFEALIKLKHELASFEVDLTEKKHCIVLTKQDIPNDEFDEAEFRQKVEELDGPETMIVKISAVAQTGLSDLRRTFFKLVKEFRAQSMVVEAPAEAPKNDDGPSYVQIAYDPLNYQPNA